MIGIVGSPNIPIVLGISGHGDIRAVDLDVLGSRIAEVFNNFRRRYPRSPLRLLTSLAPGADQLGADVANQLGIEIVAPLPFPPEVYVKSTTFEGLFEWRQFAQTCATIDRFNFDVSQHRTSLEKAIRISTGSDPWDQFLKKPTIRGSIAANGIRALLAVREAAAFLARRFELPSIVTLRLLFIMLFITGFFFDVYAHTNVSQQGAENKTASETVLTAPSTGAVISPTATSSPGTKASPSAGPTGQTGELHNSWFLSGFVMFLVFDFALVEVMSILQTSTSAVWTIARWPKRCVCACSGPGIKTRLNVTRPTGQVISGL
jgi:hypothetical protein